MDRAEAIRYLEQQKAVIADVGTAVFGYHGYDALCSAVDALREQEALARNSHDVARACNAPLTLEELRGMDGEPVYVVSHDGRLESQWCILSISDTYFPKYSAASIGGCEYAWFDCEDYGKTWEAYRQKPEEVAKDVT